MIEPTPAARADVIELGFDPGSDVDWRAATGVTGQPLYDWKDRLAQVQSPEELLDLTEGLPKGRKLTSGAILPEGEDFWLGIARGFSPIAYERLDLAGFVKHHALERTATDLVHAVLNAGTTDALDWLLRACRWHAIGTGAPSNRISAALGIDVADDDGGPTAPRYTMTSFARLSTMLLGRRPNDRSTGLLDCRFADHAHPVHEDIRRALFERVDALRATRESSWADTVATTAPSSIAFADALKKHELLLRCASDAWSAALRTNAALEPVLEFWWDAPGQDSCAGVLLGSDAARNLPVGAAVTPSEVRATMTAWTTDPERTRRFLDLCRATMLRQPLAGDLGPLTPNVPRDANRRQPLWSLVKWPASTVGPATTGADLYPPSERPFGLLDWLILSPGGGATPVLDHLLAGPSGARLLGPVLSQTAGCWLIETLFTRLRCRDLFGDPKSAKQWAAWRDAHGNSMARWAAASLCASKKMGRAALQVSDALHLIEVFGDSALARNNEGHSLQALMTPAGAVQLDRVLLERARAVSLPQDSTAVPSQKRRKM